VLYFRGIFLLKKAYYMDTIQSIGKTIAVILLVGFTGIGCWFAASLI